MKEIELLPIKEEKEIVKPIKKQVKFLGSIRKIKGLTLFEFNVKTKSLEAAKYEDEPYIDLTGGKSKIRHNVKLNQDCIYFQALNINVAKRKIGLLII